MAKLFAIPTISKFVEVSQLVIYLLLALDTSIPSFVKFKRFIFE